MSSTTGNITMVQSIGHSYVGNNILMTGASYRALTNYTTLNTCSTYRISN